MRIKLDVTPLSTRWASVNVGQNLSASGIQFARNWRGPDPGVGRNKSQRDETVNC